MNTDTKPTNKRLEAVRHIEENSTCLNQLSYNKRNKTSYEFRAKVGGNTFILITHNEGNDGFEIFYPDKTMTTDEAIENFDLY